MKDAGRTRSIVATLRLGDKDVEGTAVDVYGVANKTTCSAIRALVSRFNKVPGVVANAGAAVGSQIEKIDTGKRGVRGTRVVYHLNEPKGQEGD